MDESSKPRRPRAGVRVIVFLAIVVALWVAGQTIAVDEAVSSIRMWAHELGPWAPLAFVGGYVLATLAGVPGTPLTVIAAVLFGPRDGLIVAIIASSTTAVAGFWIARTVARAPLERWLSKRPAYERLHEILARNEWTAIPLLRVQPLFPFTLVNYALGLSRVPFWKYLLASEVGMIPMNVVWIYSAVSVYEIVLRGEIPWAMLGVTLGAAAILVVLVYLGRRIIASINGGRQHEGRAA